ncbi:MAG: hypothetical protein U1E73_06410 [Planctomycetota bacterium]
MFNSYRQDKATLDRVANNLQRLFISLDKQGLEPVTRSELRFVVSLMQELRDVVDTLNNHVQGSST